MRDTKVIVFDLDGTLYEDTHHFSYYAEKLKSKLPTDTQDIFQKDYENVLAGKHPLKMGRVYDVHKDRILVHDEGHVLEGYTWEGVRIEEEEIKRDYQQPLAFDFTTMLSIGDLWWIPVSIAAHYGVTREVSYECFMQTREHMMTPEFVLVANATFNDTLKSLTEKYKVVLMTNSPQSDSDVIIEKLGFTSYFEHKVYEASKPIHTKKNLNEIANTFNVSPEEMLSIGDNYINEILPAKQLGCKTIYIDAHHLGEAKAADKTVKNLDELSAVLNTQLL
ncbi:MAG: HAD family hydrolase [Bacillaceae bacterium]|nr:HAD family hydrolase [Bacillaceae bacterium]